MGLRLVEGKRARISELLCDHCPLNAVDLQLTAAGTTVFTLAGFTDGACVTPAPNGTSTNVPFGVSVTGTGPAGFPPTASFGNNCVLVTASAAVVAPALALLAVLVAFL